MSTKVKEWLELEIQECNKYRNSFTTEGDTHPELDRLCSDLVQIWLLVLKRYGNTIAELTNVCIRASTTDPKSEVKLSIEIPHSKTYFYELLSQQT